MSSGHAAARWNLVRWVVSRWRDPTFGQSSLLACGGAGYVGRVVHAPDVKNRVADPAVVAKSCADHCFMHK